MLGVRIAFWIFTSLLVAAGSVLLIGPIRHETQLPTRPREAADLPAANIA